MNKNQIKLSFLGTESCFYLQLNYKRKSSIVRIFYCMQCGKFSTATTCIRAVSLVSLTLLHAHVSRECREMRFYDSCFSFCIFFFHSSFLVLYFTQCVYLPRKNHSSKFSKAIFRIYLAFFSPEFIFSLFLHARHLMIFSGVIYFFLYRYEQSTGAQAE